MSNSGILWSDFNLGSHYPAYKSWWAFKWSASETSTPGQTKVSWQLATISDTSTTYEWWTWIYLDIDGVRKETLGNDKRTFPGANSDYSNTKTYASGEFIVTHDANGAGSFTAKIGGRIHKGGGTQEIGNASQTFTLDTNLPYSNCTNPSTVTLSPAIQKPGGLMTVTWSGHEGGDGGNSISKFEVEYKIGSGNWTKLDDVGGTLSKTTFYLPSGNRGSSIQARVRSIGSVDGYSPTSAKTSGSCKVNNKPSKPTITTSGNKIPSTGGTITITAVAGGSNDTNQTTSIWYSTTGSTADEKEYTRALSAGVGTYTFWTWDELEYSDPVKVTITKNTEPQISVSLGGSTGDYIIAPRATCSPNNYQEYQYYLIISKSKNFSGTHTFQLGKSAQSSYSTADIRRLTEATLKTLGKDDKFYYKIGARAYDGLEWSSIAYSDYRSIQAQPHIENIYTAPSLTGDSRKPLDNKYLSKTIQVTLQKDTNYNKIYLKIVNGSNIVYETSQTAATGTSSIYSTFTLPSFPGGNTYTLYIKPTYSKDGQEFDTNWEQLTNTNGNKFISKKSFAISNLQLGKTSINPYTSDETTLAFGTILEIKDDSALNSFGLNSNSTIQISGFYAGVQTEETVDLKIKEKGTLEGDTLSFSISNKNYQDLFNLSTIKKNTATWYNAELRVSITDLFGETISNKTMVKVSYVTDGTKPTITSKGHPVLCNDNDYLYITEGCKVDIKSDANNHITITHYHNIDTITIYNADGENILSLKNKEGYTTDSKSFPYVTKINGISKLIGTIKKDRTNTQITITATTDAGQRISSYQTVYKKDGEEYKTIASRALIKGSCNLLSASLDEKKLSCSIRIGGFGTALQEMLTTAGCNWASLTIELIQPKVTTPLLQANKIGSQLVSQQIELSSKPETYVDVKIKCTLFAYPKGYSKTSTASASISWESNIIQAYQKRPTLAYRKNALGINYDFPNTSSITNPSLVIGAHDNSKIVYFISAHKTAQINLETGEQSGFIYHIDCGTWDSQEI